MKSLLFLLLGTISPACLMSQAPCSDKDIYSVPGTTVIKPGGQGTQWARMEPIRKELQRIMPSPIVGLHATYSIAFGGNGQPWDEGKKSPRTYDNYLMLKKYECNRASQRFVPEGETGCWAYFTVNSFDNGKTDIPGRSDIDFHGYYSPLYICEIWEEKDANGNRVLYYNTMQTRNQRWGIIITVKDKLPMRRISREELILSYTHQRDSVLNQEIRKQQDMLDRDKKKYEAMTDAQKKEENYWPGLFQDWETRLRTMRTEQSDMAEWTKEQLQSPKRKEEARIKYIARYTGFAEFKEQLGTGMPVYIYDKDFFDYLKPIDEPQYLFVWNRRTDAFPPKKQFMDLLYSSFNLDILYRMVGAAPRKPGGINTLDASIGDAKTETVKAQGSTGAKMNYSLDNAIEGKPPAGWQTNPAYTVKKRGGNNMIALDKEGFIYPQQLNREIADGFVLRFSLQWPPTISYYSPLFVLSIGDMAYDNPRQAYVDNTADMDYLMRNATEANGRSRVVLRFDPHFNDGGSLNCYAYNAINKQMNQKNILLPTFYRQFNKNQIELRREGNHLVLTDNGAPMARFENVFVPGVRYNFFTFGIHNTGGNEAPQDIFYLGDVSVENGK